MDVDQIAGILGLGRVHGGVVNLKPGDMNAVWAVETDTGPWVVKTQQPRGPWWHETVRRSAELERAAAAAGIAVAEAAPPCGGEVIGMWQHLGGEQYARAIRRVSGQQPPTPLRETLARWAGWCMATLENSSIVADPTDDAIRTVPSLDEWDQWLGQAKTLGVLTAGQAARLRGTVCDVSEVIATSGTARRVAQVLHGDVTRYNIIVADSGPVLLDFDSAGPNVAWWEFVGHAFSLASADLGRDEPDRATIDTLLDSYASAGGSTAAADETAFTGALTQRVSYAAFLLWVACGHRGGAVEHQRKAAADLAGAIETLPVIAARVSAWAAWLR